MKPSPHSEQIESKNLQYQSDIRRRAEAELKGLPENAENIAEMSPAEIKQLIHELQVHQIELKMQNDELRYIQNDLETARNRYSHLFNFAPVGYFSMDETAAIMEANLTFCMMMGIERREMIGKNFTHWIHPDDQDLLYLHKRRLMASEVQQSCELRLINKDGKEIFAYLECMISKDTPGNTRLIRATVNDITLHKQTQLDLELFRDLINQANDAIYVIDAHTGDFLNANDQASLDLNYTRDEILKLKIFDIETDLDDPVEWIKFVMKTRNTGSLLVETEHQRSDGTQFPVEINARFIQKADKEFIVMAARDILERQTLETQLRHMQKMNSLGTLTGGIAHEFNNLLFQISGNTEILIGNAEDDAKRMLTEIFNATRRGARLVKQMLTFSRQAIARFQPTSLNEVIKTFKILLDRLLPPDIEIRMTLADNLYPVNLDRGQMEQVLMNLCINAKDAMPAGGQLTIKTTNSIITESLRRKYPHIQAGKCVLLSVKDTGQGIDPNIMEKIFDPFFSTKEVGKGTGLGLSVVYGIIKNHHGTVSCSSDTDFGTTFDIYLPAAATDSDTNDTVASDMPVAEGTEKILIVEDDPDILRLTRQMLERFNYSVIPVRSGESALDIYARYREAIDLIILDLGMPGIGGEKCLKKLIEIDPDVKVIIASGYHDAHLKKDITKYGAKAYITKPYILAEISEMVRRVLDGA